MKLIYFENKEYNMVKDDLKILYEQKDKIFQHVYEQ